MNVSNWRFLACLLMVGGLVTACDVEKTDEGDMPEVDVDYESGEMPDYDVDWADVDVGTRTKTVSVPKIAVYTEEEQVEVPYLDFDMPDAGESEERSVVVELEVSETKPELEIESVYASDRRLYVISRLTKTGTSLAGERARISDRIMLNAPDLDVKHLIIGERLEGNWNQQYTFVPDISAVRDRVGKKARKIYGR